MLEIFNIFQAEKKEENSALEMFKQLMQSFIHLMYLNKTGNSRDIIFIFVE
jgi:hypothetical protein